MYIKNVPNNREVFQMKKKQTLYSSEECNFENTAIEIKDLEIKVLEEQEEFIRPHLGEVA